jgi:hypothetical protein
MDMALAARSLPSIEGEYKKFGYFLQDIFLFL